MAAKQLTVYVHDQKTDKPVLLHADIPRTTPEALEPLLVHGLLFRAGYTPDRVQSCRIWHRVD